MSDFFYCAVCAEQKLIEEELSRTDGGDDICKPCDAKLEIEAERDAQILSTSIERSRGVGNARGGS